MPPYLIVTNAFLVIDVILGNTSANGWPTVTQLSVNILAIAYCQSTDHMSSKAMISQLSAQFLQLRREACKIKDFNGD